jgi:hypothetical protein
MITGIKTKFYTDVKIDVCAGMAFNNPNIYKIQKIGYDIFRHYFDSKEKDCQVGAERIKRVINK